MVNCKTDSTKNIICHQYVLLEQPISPPLTCSAPCALTCILHRPKLTGIFLTQSPRLDRKSIIILINLLYLQTRVKKIGKLILLCLEAHFGDLITFQPYGHFQRGMTSRCCIGSSGTKGNFLNTHGIVQPDSNCEAAERVYWCQTASVHLAQLTSDYRAL